LLELRGVTARDALHVAVMQREGLDRILTFDHGFDSFRGIVRVPAAL
jgi:predicted nucleic acid-binding protein